jgi:hypothetical protein
MATSDFSNISTELREIEEKQEELLRRRKEVLKGLSKVEEEASREGVRFARFRRRNSRPAVDGSDPSHINEADFHQRKKIKYNNDGRTDAPLNRKLSSAIALPEDKTKKLGSAVATEKEEEEFKVEKPKMRLLPTEIKRRNSNLFKNMMGHLNKAKTTLESQKTLISQQDQAKHEAEHKNQEESSKLKEVFVKTLEEKRTQLLKDKIILEKGILEEDKARLLKKTELNYSELTNYILSKEKPQIFWKPVKAKEAIDKLREETKNIVKEKKEKAIHLLEEAMNAKIEALHKESSLEDEVNGDEKHNDNDNENDTENKKNKDDSNAQNDQNDLEKDDDHLEESDESDIDKHMDNE